MGRVWSMYDVPRKPEMAAYLARVEDIRSFPGMTGAPELPVSMDDLTHTGANDIELVLLCADQLFRRMADSWAYAGETGSGGF